MSVGTIGNLSINAYTNYITLTFAKPANTTKYVISLTDVVHGYNPEPITIYASAFGSTITFDFPGLNPGYKYYVYVTPYNGSTAGVTKQYQNSSSQNLVILPVAKTTTVSVTPTGSTNNNTQTPGPGPVTTKSPTGQTLDQGIITPSPSAGSNTPTNNPPADIASTNRVLVDVSTELSPNQNYDIKVRAVSTDSSGNTIFSEWSNPFNITTPAFSASGANFNSPNVNTNTQLSGGAVYAGTFSDAGSIDVVSGVTTGTGVVLNQTGLAGYNNGVKEFYIDALTGKAYFAGQVTAGTIKIGPGVGTSGQNGIYINSKNYWYDDGSFSATSIDVAGTLLNTTDAASIPKPNAPTGLTSSWTGTTLNVTWSWTAGSPDFSKDFILSFTEGSATKSVILPISARSYSFSLAENKSMFGFVSTSINLSIVAEDRFGNQSTATTAAAATYVPSLSAPTITVSSVTNGYSVAWNSQTDPSFNAISIEEVESSSSTNPGTGYNVVYAGTLNPSIIISPNTNKRWVRARFVDTIGNFTAYSTAYAITPTSPVTVNTTSPTEVTIGTVSWSGNNIVVPFTIPSTNAGIRYLIKLTAPNSQIGYFYFFPNGTSNLNQSYTITKSEIFAQFGQYFSSFSGVMLSYSVTDVPSSGVSFNVPARANGLSGITPTPTIIAVVDGYALTFDFSTVPATYAEVYEKFTNTSWPTQPPDAITMSYVSGGSTNATTLTVNNVKDNDGNTLTSVIDGYIITGTGIPANTYVSSVSGSAPTFTLTLSNPLTTQASGTYSMQGLVYSGPSPANIFNNLYVPTSVVIRYYDDFGNSSLTSAALTITPINPALSLIQNAVQVGGTAGAIYVGSSSSTGARILLGVDSYYNTNNSYSGIFAYDGSATTGTSPTTSIISNAGSGGYTFSTINAKIADWAISSNKIESLLISGITKYTGLSASNTNYAFWAGATSSSNSDNTAPFSVTPLGAVKASNITISGGQLDVGASSSNLSSGFHVTSAGVMYATGAIVNGTITATGGSFSGNVSIASGITGGASIYSGTLNSNGSLTSAGFILNSTGLTFSNSTTQGITTIDATTGLFTTKSANIGGWTVGNPNITATSGTGTITLDSTNAKITANTTSGSSYYVGLAAPSATNTTVLWAGNSATPSSNAFYVNADGTLHASNATISGAITATSGTFTGSITASTITGSSFQTLTYLTSGQGVKISNSGSDVISFSYGASLAGSILGYSSGIIQMQSADNSSYVSLSNGNSISIGTNTGGSLSLNSTSAQLIFSTNSYLSATSGGVTVGNASGIATAGLRNIVAASGSNPYTASSSNVGLIVLVY
jgi:hypothetical protein